MLRERRGGEEGVRADHRTRGLMIQYSLAIGKFRITNPWQTHAKDLPKLYGISFYIANLLL